MKCQKESLLDALAGLLLGTAVGDALGLPYEGLNSKKIQRMLRSRPLRHCFWLNHGMVSDDTEMTYCVALSLLTDPKDASQFQRNLARQLRLWFLGLPVGIGLATLKGCVKLWLGFSPARSGVFSAGNGPAVRSALIGAYFSDDPLAVESFVQASAVISHTDPKANIGALAVARLAGWGVENHGLDPNPADPIFAILQESGKQDAEWLGIIDKMRAAFHSGKSLSEYVDTMGLSRGVTGYVYHTVPVAVYAWLRHHGDFRSMMESVVKCGGDTDSVAAIVGALAGCASGANGIPTEWVDGIRDWPLSTQLLKDSALLLSRQKLEGTRGRPLAYPWPKYLLRSPFFLAGILVHIVRRRLLPF